MHDDTGAPRARPKGVGSVTVSFNPDLSRLARQIVSLGSQVDDIILVDNGTAPPIEERLRSHLGAYPGFDARALTILALGENRGVAHGFNIGIREALRRGLGFVLLLDHDSIPTPGMAAALRSGYERGSAQAGTAPVAAVGPRVNDLRDAREYPFIRLGWTHNRHLRCGNAQEGLIACDFLISSGAFIALESFPAVGEFDESLFIDSVDLEWCCRARSRGYVLFGVCAARLDHQLGDHRRKVLNGITMVVHAPERIYYMTRNRFLLYQRAYMPLKWKLKDFLRVIAKFCATMLLIAPRGQYARMTLRALRDAAAGRGGKLRGDGG
ncbi:MAG: glycosyltransferase family 2 protein [Usitatibacter sp.]